jgi:hypothetical protein
MHRASRSFFCMVILAMAGMITATAWAHRDRGPNDPCRKQVGASLLHLTLYQPHFDPDAEYCEEVPRAGKTIMVVDVTEGELRQAPMSLEVMAANATGQSRTILSLSPQVYQRGVVATEVTLDEGSDYIARVVVELGGGRGPQSLSFPIQVAAWYRAMIKPALMVVGLLLFIAISIIRYKVGARQQESSVGRTGVRRVAN